jgi:hypothetical protein
MLGANDHRRPGNTWSKDIREMLMTKGVVTVVSGVLAIIAANTWSAREVVYTVTNATRIARLPAEKSRRPTSHTSRFQNA